MARDLISRVLCSAALTIGAAEALAGPQHFWASEGNGRALARIDVSSGGTSTVFADHGKTQAWATAFTPDGRLWTTYDALGGNARLGYFDLLTGAITSVGSGTGVSMMCLEADAAGQLYGVGYADQNLYKIDQTTGTVTAVGNTLVSAMVDLAFDSSGQLWGIDESYGLYLIDLANGSSQLAHTISGVAGNAYGIGFDVSDTLYLTSRVSNSGIHSVDLNSGFATFLRSSGVSNTVGGDFEPQTIPLPSAAWLAALGLGAMALIRKRPEC